MTPAPHPQVNIREALEHDLEAIREIYNAAIPSGMATADLTPQTPEARQAWWRDRDLRRRPVLVAADDAGTVIAWGSFSDFKPRAAYAPCAEISVYVAPAAAGRGVGQRMLDALLACAPGCGIDRILARVAQHHVGEAHFQNLIRRRRADVRLDYAWDLITTGRKAEGRALIREAQRLAPTWKGMRMRLRSMLPA